MSTVLNHCHKDTYIIHVMTTQRHLYVLWRDVTDMYILHIIASQTHVYPPYHGVHKYTYSHVYSFCDITNTPTCILSVLWQLLTVLVPPYCRFTHHAIGKETSRRPSVSLTHLLTTWRHSNSIWSAPQCCQSNWRWMTDRISTSGNCTSVTW